MVTVCLLNKLKALLLAIDIVNTQKKCYNPFGKGALL